ncbi:MAG: hypothetical protein ACOYIQ_04125 [Christensenellales bacterium]|jgi:hypothetical protein
MNIMDMLPLLMGMGGKKDGDNMANMASMFKNFGGFNNPNQSAQRESADNGGNSMPDMANIMQLMNMMNKSNQSPKKQTSAQTLTGNFFQPINGLSCKRIDRALLELMQLRYGGTV